MKGVSRCRCLFQGVVGAFSPSSEGFESQKGGVGAEKHSNGELESPFDELLGVWIGDEGGVVSLKEVQELELEALSEDDGVDEDLRVVLEHLAEQDFA